MSIAYEMTCPACGRADHTNDCPRRERPAVRRRATTESMKRLSKRTLAILTAENPPVEGVERPRTRAECVGGERPCPWVSCAHHLYLDVNARTGSIKHNFPGLEVWEMSESCALDVADEGGETLESVGEIVNLTRERVRQIETRGIAKLRTVEELSLCEINDDPPEYLPMVRVRRSIPRCEDHRTSTTPLPEARPWSSDDHSSIFGLRPYAKRDER